MLTLLANIGGMGLLALASLGMLGAFHFLLFREYFKAKKLQTRKLIDLEKLVQAELSRSKVLIHQIENLQQLKSETDEKLGLIKILLELIKKDEKKGPHS